MSRVRRQFCGWVGLFLGLQLLVTYLNRYHTAEQVIFRTNYLDMAAYFRGEGARTLLTFPIWGYSLLFAVLPSIWGVLLLQAVLSAVTMAAVRTRLAALAPAGGRRLTLALLIGGLPWYCLQSVKWPAAPAASLLVLSLLALERALRGGGWAPAAWGGLLLGLSLNFRSDFLAFPPFLLLVALLWRWLRREPALPLAPVALSSVVAVACLLPWGAFYDKHSGHFSLTSSNSGMVAYIALGQLPHNPWHIAPEDGSAHNLVRAIDPNMVAYSDEGNRIMTRTFLTAVRQHPVAFVLKVGYNVLSVFYRGLYTGEPPLTQQQQDELDALKQRIEPYLGMVPNSFRIQQLRESGVWDNPHLTLRYAAVLAYQVVTIAAADLFLILAALGLVQLTRRRAPLPPLYLLCGAAFIYQVLLSGLMLYQPRHITVVYLCCVPFCVAGWEALRWRRRAQVVPAA